MMVLGIAEVQALIVSKSAEELSSTSAKTSQEGFPFPLLGSVSSSIK